MKVIRRGDRLIKIDDNNYLDASKVIAIIFYADRIMGPPGTDGKIYKYSKVYLENCNEPIYVPDILPDDLIKILEKAY